MKLLQRHGLMLAVGVGSTVMAMAQVPADIEGELLHIGKIVDPACTAKLYRPLMPAHDITSNANPLYPGITIARNAAFGPNPKDVIDIFTTEQGPASRPVLIYVPGGGGNKIELQATESHAFYDNIGRWAVKNGLVGVTMQRHPSPTWDDGAKDISAMIQYIQANIARFHGNPERLFIWAHSAGNVPLGTYLGHPEVWGPKGVGVKGAILMSSASFNILPLKVETGTPQDTATMFAKAGKTCGAGGPASTDGALPGVAAGQPGGPAPEPAGGPLPAPAPVSAETSLARSNLPGLKQSTVKLLLANGELDIGTGATPDNLMPFNKALSDELCREGPAHCPTLLVAKGHSHMSIVFSIDAPDTSVSAPILKWIRQVK